MKNHDRETLLNIGKKVGVTEVEVDAWIAETELMLSQKAVFGAEAGESLRKSIRKIQVTGSGKSLNPSDAQIRAWEIEETLRRTRKTTGELFPNAGDLHAALTKPVNKIKYYQIARCWVKYQVG